jgi:hypothetical protein
MGFSLEQRPGKDGNDFRTFGICVLESRVWSEVQFRSSGFISETRFQD